jgi:hypothetical protein
MTNSLIKPNNEKLMEHGAPTSTDVEVLDQDITEIVPKTPWWGYIAAVAFGAVAVLLPRHIDLPANVIWLRANYAAAILGPFGFGFSLALLRLLRLTVWKARIRHWSPRALAHVYTRLGSDAVTSTPGSLREETLRDCKFSLHSAVDFSAWPLIAISFLIWLAAFPLMGLLLKELGRQTDLLSGLWVAVVAIVFGSAIWLAMFCGSSIGKTAITKWYATASELLDVHFQKAVVDARRQSSAVVQKKVEPVERDEFSPYGLDDGFSTGDYSDTPPGISAPDLTGTEQLSNNEEVHLTFDADAMRPAAERASQTPLPVHDDLSGSHPYDGVKAKFDPLEPGFSN